MAETRCDGELVREARAGSPEAFGELLARYKDSVFGVACHRLGDFEEPRDAAQEALVRAFMSLSKLREPAAFAHWLCRIGDGTALDTLPDAGRLAVILHYVNGYSHAEVAGFLGTTEGAVKTRVSRGKARLREEMAEMVAGRLKEERPTIRCAYTHPRQRNTEYTVITDSAEEELRKTLLAGGFRIKSLKLLSEAELKAEERRRRDWEGKLIRDAVQRALEAQAQAVRFALAGSERWVSIHHLVAGKWVSAARLATGGGRGVAIPDGWTVLTLWRGLSQRLAGMAAMQLDSGQRRQTDRLRLRLGGRAHDFQVSFNRRSIRIDLDR